ncbi:hypothetical protein ACQKOH_21935 [Sphingomonas sp. NPDC092331]|jgi:hypothetical protein|uniref:hypothetical protein n=1 Tax=unclassified Sphingomonas TaxID=196159 RepID=UPI0031F5DA1B
MSKKIGEVYALRVAKGFAVLQVTHVNSQYGEMVRAFDLVLADYKDFECGAIETSKVAFTTFFPASAALRKGIVAKLGKCPIRADLVDFPTFKNAMYHPVTGQPAIWWLWDGVDYRKYAASDGDLSAYPDEGVMNDTALIENLDKRL